MSVTNSSFDPKTEICARKRQTRYLPADLLFSILSLLPAQVLIDVMSHVCKEWNLIIRSQDFICRHLRNSTSGILIQCLKDGNGIYVEFQRGCLEIHKFDCGDVAWTSCNGLVLAPNRTDDRILHVINPLTKQHYTLPQYRHQIKHHQYFCLAYVEASMEYKVVHARGSEFSLKPRFAVLTIGVDKDWRYIDIDQQHLRLITSEQVFVSSLPLVTGTYVHWIGTGSFGHWIRNAFVLTLNVETETIRLFPYPKSWSEYRKVLPMGSNLSFIYGFNKYFNDVWEMNPETGNWIKLFRIDFRPMMNKFKHLFPEYWKKPEYWEQLVPFGWLKVREVLLFSWLGVCCIAYNHKTKEIHPFKLDTEMNHFQAHMNSLILLD